MSIALGLLGVLALILANGYFVTAEFAYVAARKGRIEELAEDGDRRAKRALDVLKRLSFVLSGAQLGITATSLAVGYIAEPVFRQALAPLFRLAGIGPEAAFAVSITVGLVISTSAQMVLGELGPKNLAIAAPERFALALARSTWLYTRMAGPIITLFDRSANGLLRLLGIEPVEELTGGVDPAELGIIIETSGKEGTLSRDQATLLRRALEFRTLRAAAAMVARPQVVTITETDTCEDLRQLAVATGHSRFPVIGDGIDELRGVVVAKDILGVPPAERARTPVSALMKDALVMPESTLLGPLLSEMRDAHTQLAVVIDEYGGIAGIVTLEDIVEEIVGEIQDEYDAPEPAARHQPDGSWLVPGRWRVDETARLIDAPLPEGDYDSVGGMVMAHLQRVPEVGDVVEVPRVRLTVREMDNRAVAWLHVQRDEQREETQ